MKHKTIFNFASFLLKRTEQHVTLMMDLLRVRNRKNCAFVYDLAAAIVRKVYEVVVGQKVFPLSSIRNVYIFHIKVIMVAKTFYWPMDGGEV